MPVPIQFDRSSPHVAKITFSNSPVGLVTGALVERLAWIIDGLAADEDLRVLVFESNVPDFFLNHFDLGALDSFPKKDESSGISPWTRITMMLTNASYITVGVIRGRTRGGGNELALALDRRYASIEKAIFGQPEVGTSVVPGGGGTERLPLALGRDRALEVILTSADYDAATAERWDWVTRALPDAELDDFVDKLTERISAFDPGAVATAKRMVNRATLPPDEDLIAAYDEFLHSTTLPAYVARASTPLPSGQKVVELEYRLGDALGAAAVARARNAVGS